MLRAVVWSLGVAAASAQHYEFCTGGLSSLDVADDAGVPSVDLIVLQAPLFSSTPKIGQKLKYLGMFHTAVAFAQDVGSERNYWTLEFDFASGSLLDGLMPRVDGRSLTWNNDARFCLTKGILWGRDHWTQVYETVARMTAAQARSIMEGFVMPLNSSAHGQFPQYQLWRAGKRDQTGRISQPLVRDVTCADGAIWVLHHVISGLGIPLRQGFQLRATTAAVNAERWEEVSPTDYEEWGRLVLFYERMNKFGHNSTVPEKVLLLLEMVWHEYVYDTNSGKYYRLLETRFPWIRVEYALQNLTAPPMAFHPAQSLLVQI